MLAGLLSEFDAIVSSASLSLELVPFQHLVDAFLECENYQLRAVQEVALHANLVEETPSQAPEGSVHGGHPPSSGHGKGFWLYIQCHICNRFGHLAQRCFYQFNRDFDGSTAMARALSIGDQPAPTVSRQSPVLGFSNKLNMPHENFVDEGGWSSAQRMRFTCPFGQNRLAPGQNWVPTG